MRSALFLCFFVPTLAVAIPYSNDDLQPLPGDIEANARGINAHGVIVGQSISPDRLPSAVLWESALDSPRLLSGVGDFPREPELTEAFRAFDINDVGWVGGVSELYIRLNSRYIFGGAGPVVWDPAGELVDVPSVPGSGDARVARILNSGLACVRGDQTYWFSVHTGTVFLSPSNCNRAPRIPEPGFLWALSLIPLVLATIADRLRTR